MERAHTQGAPPTRAPQVRKNNASGWAQLAMARKLEPNLSYQFSIFTREQEHKQRSAAGGSGEQVRKLCGWLLLVSCLHAALCAGTSGMPV